MGETKQGEAGALKKGSYVVFDDKACIVRDNQKSKPGKHGAKKCRIEAITMIDGQKIIKVMPASEKIIVPIIGKKTAQALSIQGDSVNVMDMETYETFDLKIPEEFKDKIVEGKHILFWEILDDKIIKEVRDAP